MKKFWLTLIVIAIISCGVLIARGKLYKIDNDLKVRGFVNVRGDVYPIFDSKYNVGKPKYWFETSYIDSGQFHNIIIWSADSTDTTFITPTGISIPNGYFDSLWASWGKFGNGDTALTLTEDGWEIIKKYDAWATDTVSQTADDFTWTYHRTGSMGGTIQRQLRFVDPATWRDSTNMNMIIGRIDTTDDMDVNGKWVTCTTLIWTSVGRSQQNPLAQGFYRIYTNATDQTVVGDYYKGALVIESPNVIDATSDDYGQLRVKMKRITLDAYGWWNSPMDVYGKIQMLIGCAGDTASLTLGASSARVFSAKGFTYHEFIQYCDPETLYFTFGDRSGTGQKWFIFTMDSADVNLDTVMMHGGILIAKKRVESLFGDFADSTKSNFGRFIDSVKTSWNVSDSSLIGKLVGCPKFGVAIYKADFTYNGGDVSFQACLNGWVITDCYLEITTTFDGTGVVTVGDNSNDDGFLEDADINQGVVGYYGDDADEHGGYLWDDIGSHKINYIYPASLPDPTATVYVTQGTSTQGAGTSWIVVQRLK